MRTDNDYGFSLALLLLTPSFSDAGRTKGPDFLVVLLKTHFGVCSSIGNQASLLFSLSHAGLRNWLAELACNFVFRVDGGDVVVSSGFE